MPQRPIILMQVICVKKMINSIYLIKTEIPYTVFKRFIMETAIRHIISVQALNAI